MIKIMDTNNGITVFCVGKISRILTSVGRKKTITSLGVNKTETIRNVINLNINIEFMSEDDYLNLEKIFLIPKNNIDIEDTDRAIYYSEYYLEDDTISLDEKIDIEQNAYYYVGGIRLSKR